LISLIDSFFKPGRGGSNVLNLDANIYKIEADKQLEVPGSCAGKAPLRLGGNLADMDHLSFKLPQIGPQAVNEAECVCASRAGQRVCQ
jgi:hypothetical protein